MTTGSIMNSYGKRTVKSRSGPPARQTSQGHRGTHLGRTKRTIRLAPDNGPRLDKRVPAARLQSGLWPHRYGAISRVSVNWIKCTGGA